MTSKFLTVLVAYCLIGLTNNAFAQSNQLTTIELKIGIYRIEAELADTSVARQTGLMYRSFLPTNSGMLFVIEEKGIHCFFMRNTKVALSIAFIDDDGGAYNQADAGGFIKLNALRMRIAEIAKRKRAK